MYYQIFKCKYTGNCTINVETRRNCQFCRFKLCLSSGMKTSWVLSDEERNRRFNKINKVNNKKVIKRTSNLMELSMGFTVEEQRSLEDIRTKFLANYCPVTWLNTLISLNKESAVNLVESVHGLKPITATTWDYMNYAWVLQLTNNVMPHFIQGLPLGDRSRLLARSAADQGMASSLMILCPPLQRENISLSSRAEQVSKRDIDKSNMFVIQGFQSRFR